jgi:hypothetical protein
MAFLFNVFTRSFLPKLHCTHSWTEHGRSSHVASERTYRKHRLHRLFYYWMTLPRKRVLLELHSNGCTRHISWHFLYCCVRALLSNGWYLQSHLLATGLCVIYCELKLRVNLFSLTTCFISWYHTVNSPRKHVYIPQLFSAFLNRWLHYEAPSWK